MLKTVKRVAIVLLIFVLLLVTRSCVIIFSAFNDSYQRWADMCDEYQDQMGKVRLVSDDESRYYAKYERQRYNMDTLHLFRLREGMNNIPEGDVLVGWSSLPFGLWYIDTYYSYTADNPVFIYMPRLHELYLREDYRYETDTFIIEGTDARFVFSDMFSLSDTFSYQSTSHYTGERDIVLYSEQYPRLRMPLRLFRMNGVWYAGGDRDNAIFEVSDDLLDMLINSGTVFDN